MSGIEVSLQVRYRARIDESIEACHARFTEGMQIFGPPLGWQHLEPPAAPSIDPNSDDTVGLEWFRYPIKGLKLETMARFRHELSIGSDKVTSDDSISIDFKTSNKALDYRSILHEHFPKVIEAYRGYRARVYFGNYSGKYTDSGWNVWAGRETTNPTYQRLRKDGNLDLVGRNIIYTVYRAVFWDAELWSRALGYWHEEVMRRLESQAQLIRPLLDGVYIVFNDDPALAYEAFVEMNLRFKKLLDVE